jgi:hypothetical protein
MFHIGDRPRLAGGASCFGFLSSLVLHLISRAVRMNSTLADRLSGRWPWWIRGDGDGLRLAVGDVRGSAYSSRLAWSHSRSPAMLAVGGASTAANGVTARSRDLTYEQMSSHREEAVIGPQRS